MADNIIPIEHPYKGGGIIVTPYHHDGVTTFTVATRPAGVPFYWENLSDVHPTFEAALTEGKQIIDTYGKAPPNHVRFGVN